MIGGRSLVSHSFDYFGQNSSIDYYLQLAILGHGEFNLLAIYPNEITNGTSVGIIEIPWPVLQ